MDTRASKGRKIRYTVHEKLKNFMAPCEAEIDEGNKLLRSLFGKAIEEEEEMDQEEVNALKDSAVALI